MVDVLQVLANWQIYSANFDSVKNLVQQPLYMVVKVVALAGIVNSSWGFDFLPYMPYVVPPTLLVWILTNWFLGKSEPVKDFKNKMIQSDRHNNDVEMKKALAHIEKLVKREELYNG